MKRRIDRAILLAGLLTLGLVGEVYSQNPAATASIDSGDGIAVFGTGEVSARPNWVEIDLNVSGKAELTGDALIKYRDSKKRLIDALAKLQLKDLSTQERGVSISAGNSVEQQQRALQGQAVGGKPQIEVSSTVRVQLKNIRDVPVDELVKTIGKLIDVAQDAGVNVGLTQAELLMRQRYGMLGAQSTNVRFVVADLAELREKAYEQAVADAAARAARLAKLNRVKLGPTLSVQEIRVAGDDQASAAPQPNPYYPFLNQTTPLPETSAAPRISSPTLSDVPVQVRLLVRFAIIPAEPATAQK